MKILERQEQKIPGFLKYASRSGYYADFIAYGRIVWVKPIRHKTTLKPEVVGLGVIDDLFEPPPDKKWSSYRLRQIRAEQDEFFVTHMLVVDQYRRLNVEAIQKLTLGPLETFLLQLPYFK